MMNTNQFFALAATCLLLLAPSQSDGQDNQDSDQRYVRVDSSSDDAVMQDSTDVFESNPLCRLRQNQKVTVLEAEGGYLKIRAICKGETVEGWVRKRALAKKPFNPEPKVSPSGAVDAAAFGGNASVNPGIEFPPADEPDEKEDAADKEEQSEQEQQD